jgi:hypothetical protein
MMGMGAFALTSHVICCFFWPLTSGLKPGCFDVITSDDCLTFTSIDLARAFLARSEKADWVSLARTCLATSYLSFESA